MITPQTVFHSREPLCLNLWLDPILITFENTILLQILITWWHRCLVSCPRYKQVFSMEIYFHFLSAIVHHLRQIPFSLSLPYRPGSSKDKLSQRSSGNDHSSLGATSLLRKAWEFSPIGMISATSVYFKDRESSLIWFISKCKLSLCMLRPLLKSSCLI